MDINTALSAFSALSQGPRLDLFRLLVTAGDDGLSVGDIATRLEMRQNTASTNLAILLRAGLVENQRDGRTVRYFLNKQGLQGLLSFLMDDCCGGQPELCGPAIAKYAGASPT